MRKTKFIIASLILAICTIWTTFAIPDYYRANYTISKDWENIKKIFVEIQANSQIWESMPPETFISLNQSFNNVFPKFPQDYNFQIVYQKCKTLSQNLWGGYNYNTFVWRMSSDNRHIAGKSASIGNAHGVRPAIEVLKSQMVY